MTLAGSIGMDFGRSALHPAKAALVAELFVLFGLYHVLKQASADVTEEITFRALQSSWPILTPTSGASAVFRTVVS